MPDFLRRVRSLALPLLAGAIVAVSIPALAHAYLASTSCSSYSSGQPCYVADGWHGIDRVKTTVFISRPELCAKARTEANNIRSTTNGSCNYNAARRLTYLTSTEPLSGGYGYFGGGGAQNINVKQCSPSDASFCD